MRGLGWAQSITLNKCSCEKHVRGRPLRSPLHRSDVMGRWQGSSLQRAAEIVFRIVFRGFAAPSRQVPNRLSQGEMSATAPLKRLKCCKPQRLGPAARAKSDGETMSAVILQENNAFISPCVPDLRALLRGDRDEVVRQNNAHRKGTASQSWRPLAERRARRTLPPKG